MNACGWSICNPSSGSIDTDSGEMASLELVELCKDANNKVAVNLHGKYGFGECYNYNDSISCESHRYCYNTKPPLRTIFSVGILFSVILTCFQIYNLLERLVMP